MVSPEGQELFGQGFTRSLCQGDTLHCIHEMPGISFSCVHLLESTRQ